MQAKDNKDFSIRLTEICGSGDPGNIQRLLGISYQAARNYLDGRLPDTRVLLLIAAKTPYSLHWLLTGKGEKLAETNRLVDTPIFTDQIRGLIRAECREAVNNYLSAQKSEPRIVILEPDKIRSESVSTPEVTDVENFPTRT